MLWTTVGELLPLTVVPALSPLAVVTGLVLLLGPGGRARAAMFAVGWCSYLTLVAPAAFVLVDAAQDADAEDAAQGVSVVRLLMGLALLTLAWASWRRRPRQEETAREATLLARLTRVSPLRSTVLGFVAGAWVLVNTPVSVEAGTRVAAASPTNGAAATVILLYGVTGGAGILLPVAMSLVGGDRVSARLADLRAWLECHLTPITMTVLIVFGASFLGQGLGVLG